MSARTFTHTHPHAHAHAHAHAPALIHARTHARNTAGWELAIQLRRDVKPQLDAKGVKLFLVSIGTHER